MARIGRPPAPGKAAAKVAYFANPEIPRAEMMEIGGVQRAAVQRWIAEWQLEDPLTSEAWLALLRQRLACVMDAGLTRVFETLDEATAAQAWQIVAGAMKSAGIDAPERLLVAGEVEVREFGTGPPLVGGKVGEAGDGE